MINLTSIVITYNEEENIERCLRSLIPISNEIIVVDSFSRDKTVQLAQKYTSKVIQQAFKGYAAQKNSALEKAENDWVLFLDADEEVTPELQNEINVFKKKDVSIHAFKIKRQNYFMGQKINYSGWQNDSVIRLINKNYCKYNNALVHESIICNGAVGTLRNKINHYTYKNLPHYLAKFDQYTTLSAHDRLKKTKKITYTHLLIKPAFRFFKQYVLKKGFMDGKVGFVLSAMASYSVFLRYLKAWRFSKNEVI